MSTRSQRQNHIQWIAPIFLLTFCASCSLAQETSSSTATEPSPDLTPAQVVSAQLAALKKNDSEDNGIRITFRFASPGNKSATGPIERFIEMVKNPAYRPMLNYRSDFREPIEVSEGVAKQLVTLIDAEGQPAGYLFVLSKQKEPPCVGCWMTDSVVRVKVQPGTVKVAKLREDRPYSVAFVVGTSTGSSPNP